MWSTDRIDLFLSTARPLTPRRWPPGELAKGRTIYRHVRLASSSYSVERRREGKVGYYLS